MRLLPALLLLTSLPVLAAPLQVSLTIKGHQFVPTEIRVPAGQKVELLVENQDATPEEFESHTLDREKIIPGGATVTILIGPLKPGTYPFVGEFNEDSAKGVVIAE
jgi:heme/copper-type cytochrome/quinol oxidase subunit 2